MPTEGYTSITVDKASVETLRRKYEEKKDEYRTKYGITGFPGFVIKSVTEMLENFDEREQELKSLRQEKAQLEAQLRELRARR